MTVKYTPDHEWIQIAGADGIAMVGITHHAQDALGDVVFVDLPQAGTPAVAGRVVGEIESTKSVGELYAPVDGEIVEVNDALADDPSLVNSDPYGAGWMIAVRFTELPELLGADEYAALTAE